MAAAVNPNAVATPPGQTSRTLLVGADVIFRERIATQADGQVQLIFLDESSLTVGPGSDVTIDEFVYDPKSKTGKMSVRMTGGLVRFVGGRISKNGDVTIATPVNVIGIRGGMGFVEATATETTATNLFGTLSVKGQGGGEQVISRPGFAVTTTQGQTPGLPVKVDAAQLTRLSKSLEAPPAAAARNASGTIEGKLDGSQVSDKNSSQSPDSISPDATNQRALAAKNPSSLDSGVVRQAVQQNVSSALQTSVLSSGGVLSGDLLTTFNRVAATFKDGKIDTSSGFLRFTLNDGTLGAFQLPTRGSVLSNTIGQTKTTAYLAPDGRYFFLNATSPIVNGVGQTTYAGGQAVKTAGYQTNGSELRAYDFVTDTTGSLKFVGTNIANYQNKVETPLLMLTQASGNFSDAGQARTVTLYAGMGVDGEGVNQRAGIVVATGQVFATAASVGGNPADVNIVRGTFNDGKEGGVADFNKRFSAAASTPLDGAGNAFYGASRPDYFTLANLDYTNGLRLDSVARINAPGPVGSNGSVGRDAQFVYGLAPSAAAVSAVPGSSAPRTAQTMNGFVGGGMGMSGTLSGAGYTQFATQGADPLSVSITTSPSTNRVEAKFKFDTLPTAFATQTGGGFTFARPNGSTPPQGEFIRFELNFGSLTGTHRARSAYINDAIYAATEQRLTNDATFGSFAGNGSSSNPNPALTPVGQLSNDPTLVGLSIADRTNQGDLLYMVSSGAVPIKNLMPAGSSFCECTFMSWGWWGGVVGADDPGGFSRTERINLANYVVGVLPNVNQIPTSGSAVYNGHVVGTVRNQFDQYIAAGSFQKNWNFATRSGTMSISNFDRGNYTAQSTPVANPGQFAYTGTGTNGALTVNGAFFASPTDPVKGVGGQFLIGNTANAYRASGVIVGQR